MNQSQRHRCETTGLDDEQRHEGPGLRRVAPDSGTFLRSEPPPPPDAGTAPATRPRERQLRWRVASSSIPMLVFVRATGAIVAANDAAARAYGATHDELLESFISELVPPPDRVVDRLLRLRHPRTMWTGPLLHRRTNGSTFWGEIVVIEAGVTGSATMAIVVKIQDPHADAPRGQVS